MRLLRQRFRRAIIVALCAIVSATTHAGDGFAREVSPEQAPARREKVICGPNAVYAMLMAYSMPASDRLIDEIAPAHPAGMSLQEIREALSARGLHSVIRQCTPSQLRALNRPFIAHLKFELSGGHYVLVLSQANGIAHVLDPTNGETFTTRIDKLLNASNGYVIVPEERASIVPPLCLLGAVLVASVGYCRSRTGKKFLLLMLLLILAPSAHAATDAPQATAPALATGSPLHWRNGRNSATNCLWLLLRCAGQPVTYSDLTRQAAGESPSLAQLAEIASRYGLRLQPVQLTFDQLHKSSSPLILLMEPDGIGSGTFALLVDTGSEKVSYIEGGAVRWLQENRSDFRRNWSGYALAPAPLRTEFSLQWWPLSLLGLLGVMWCATRCRVPWRHGAALVILLVLCMHSPTRAAQSIDEEMPHEIRAALTLNANQIAPLTVTWTHERARSTDGNTMLRIGGRGPNGVGSDEHQLTIQEGVLYSRIDRRDVGDGVLEHSFDGVNYFIGRPPLSSGSSRASFTKIDMSWLAAREPTAPRFSAVYLDVAGFSIPNTSRDLSRRARVQSRILKQLSDGARFISCAQITTVEGLRTRVEIEARDPDAVPRKGADPAQAQRGARAAGLSPAQSQHYAAAMRRRFEPPASKRLIFFLDPQRGYAVTKYEERKATGAILFAVQNEQWRQVPGRALWLPQLCRISHYTGDNTLFEQPVTIGTIRVSSIEAEPKPAAMFALHYSSPGTKVHVQRADGRRESYEIPASPADLAKAIAQARDAGFLRGPGGLSRSWWFFAVVGTALMIIAVVWLSRLWLRERKVNGDL